MGKNYKMKLTLTSHDLKVNKSKDGTYWYRLDKGIKVEGLPSKRIALTHASEILKLIFKNTMKTK